MNNINGVVRKIQFALEDSVRFAGEVDGVIESAGVWAVK
jgi:hypothetical protein